MKDPLSKSPVAAFSLPPHPPKAVAEALARFDEIADQWAATSGEIDDAEHAFVQAKADALHAAVAAVKSGKDTSEDIERVERDHAATIAALRVRLAALAIATDETGTEMAIAVAEHRSEWLDRLEQAASEAEERYSAALTDARAALADLSPACGAVQYLTAFSHTEARVGTQRQFSGGRLFCDTTAVRRETDADPFALLAVLATIAAERQPAVRRVSSIAAPAAARWPVAS